MSLSFNANAVLLKRDDTTWTEERVKITSVDDIRKIFTPYQSDVSQVNIDKYQKVYYCVKFMKTGVEAKVTDENCETHYMVSPLLLVECDDIKPVDISNEVLEKLKDSIDFY